MAVSDANSNFLKDDEAGNLKGQLRGCEEHKRLLDAFGAAVQEILKLHEQQFLAIADGDDEFSRFDLLIHVANERKQSAKYAYMRHIEHHGCTGKNVPDQTRT